jgi:hypothetical protein
MLSEFMASIVGTPVVEDKRKAQLNYKLRVILMQKGIEYT